MAKFSVTVTRVEKWADDVEVEAASIEEARRMVQKDLDEGGWDEVFGDNDGDYLECWSEIGFVKSIGRMTQEESYRLGYEHGFEMASESGSSNPGCEGWDGMLINANPQFVADRFGWCGVESDDDATGLMAEYMRGCQAGANKAVSDSGNNGDGV